MDLGLAHRPWLEVGALAERTKIFHRSTALDLALEDFTVLSTKATILENSDVTAWLIYLGVVELTTSPVATRAQVWHSYPGE